MTARKPPATQSWDDFWGEVNAKQATEAIRGVTVPVPTDLPLGFKQRLNAVSGSDRDEDVHELVGLLFGPGVLAQWVAAGMGTREFQVVLAWGMAHGGGQPLTFREAFDLIETADAEGKSPGPNRAARRAATKPRKSPTGGASKRTSPASTTSARKTSQP